MRFLTTLLFLFVGRNLTAAFMLVTNSPVGQTTGNSIGAAWADINHDGHVDLFMNLFQGGSSYYLFTNNAGSLTSVASTVFGPNQKGRAGAAWADYDNDGWFDLAICAASEPRIYLYHGETNGSFKLQTNKVFSVSNLQTFSAAWSDYDNDGFVDLFVSTATAGFGGANDLLFHNNGDGTFARATNAAPARDNAVGQSAVWGDYDNDGRPDLFVASLNGGKNLLYHNDGNGNFTKVTNSPVVADGGNSGGAVWADFDNDRDLDLFVTNFSANSYFYRNEGNGTFVRVSGSPITRDGGSAGCIALDFDNDGWLDLVAAANKNLLYHNNGDGTFTKVSDDAVATLRYASSGNNSFASADVNEDGYQDLLLVNFNGKNQLFLDQPGSNAWLTIRLEGRVSNRAAIGAKVRVLATIGGREFWQLREISGGGAYFAQNELSAAFGLGDASEAKLVRIEWPSGIVQELSNVPARQILHIREPSKLQVLSSPADAEFRIGLSNAPSVEFQIETTTDLINWLPVTTKSGSMMDSSHSSMPARFFRAVER